MGADGSFKPIIIGFLCNWCCYGGADLCGVSRFQYPPYLRVIRVMCSGRVDLKFVLKAFLNGADGVFVGGCHLNDCHYNPEGNYDALILSKLCAKIIAHVGINNDRFRLEWVSAGEGICFAEIMNTFSKQVKELGPLGSSEGLGKKDRIFRLEAALKLVPYIKLVERERLRLPVRSEAGIEAFLDSGDLDTIFKETIAEKLAMSQILSLLHQKPMSTEEIAKVLGLNPSEISSHINNSSKHGFIRYDVQQNSYAIA
jgi:coenzyme F420-reducing hydrogenase delta subunit